MASSPSPPPPSSSSKKKMSSPSSFEPEHVMNYRGGSVLGKKTILKSDHFPGCQNKRLLPQIDGAPNYRQAGSLRVHGVAIPTIDGIRNVLNHIGAHTAGLQKRVLWHNLREEPVVYINGRPFVLRDVERPFSNLEYTGINRARVEQMESRLKEDILLEAARYGNKILVTDELPDGEMVDQWEQLMNDSVKTPLEVYEMLQVEGYLVDYERVPITDEKAPKEGDFDNLVCRISNVDLQTEIIFNCQMGRGRTTTGMVIATLVYLNRIGASGIPRTNSIGKVFGAGTDVTNSMQNSEEAIRRGEYAVIRSLIRVLEGGVEGKRQVDKAIDQCDSMQNLREAIATYRNSIRQPDEKKREASLSFFVEYLERYYFLICFAVYIHTERAALRAVQSDQISFCDWMRARPELYSILRRLLRRDPMGALGYSSVKPSLMNIAESVDGRPCEMSVVAAVRNGEVLGSRTVLKSDHSPGCQNLSLPERVDGAPNFREVHGFPVYGVANPTVDGIRAVIQRISSSKGGRPVLWHNMREEPVIYINGKPFVLRELERPYKNMLEYTGIDRERVEKMEARLKEDILREAERYNGAIMVIHETDDGQIHDAWEHVSAEAIKTPLEVYKHLEDEGLRVKYARVPITDGKAPKSSDFDTIALNITSSPKDTAYVFNCQMGRGRTTAGTIIACLLKLRIAHGRPIRIQLGDGYNEVLDNCSSSGEEAIGDSDPSISDDIKPGKEKEPHHIFGINDILLLRKITRLFDNGVECREVLDAIIDRCSALQNIRQAVLHYRRIFNQQHIEPRVRRVALNRGAEYLERYFRLISFAAYLGSEAFDGFCDQGETKITFKTWLHRRPEIQTMKWSIRLRPGRFFTVPEQSRISYEPQHGDVVMEAIVKARNGSVLGKGSILKMYFFPGQKTSSCIPFSGAPHIYKTKIQGLTGIEKLQYLHSLLSFVLPTLKQIYSEQCFEIEVEKRTNGMKADFPRTDVHADEQMCCNLCRQHICDYHRHCTQCYYDLCLTCCRDLRRASLVFVKGDYAGEKANSDKLTLKSAYVNAIDFSCLYPKWKANSDGSIPCGPEEAGDCDFSKLVLERIFKINWVAKMVKNAEEMVSGSKVADLEIDKCASCTENTSSQSNGSSEASLSQFSHRDHSRESFLYHPVSEDLKHEGHRHFYEHWVKGEPVIVKHVFDHSLASSWDPMSIWRGIQESGDDGMPETSNIVNAIDCLNQSEIDVELAQFIKGYSGGLKHEDGWPKMLKLKDWPLPNALEEFLLCQRPEFLINLPMVEFIHPKWGLLNLAAKLPNGTMQTEVGPKIYISYGTKTELGRGDPVTNLHVNMGDQVDLLMHSAEVNIQGWQKSNIEKIKKSSREKLSLQKENLPNLGLKLDDREVSSDIAAKEYSKMNKCSSGFDVMEDPVCSGTDMICTEKKGSVNSDKDSADVQQKVPAAAIWDVFRRQDVLKLNDFLRVHWQEVTTSTNRLVNPVSHPIYEKTFYLDDNVKRKLKEEHRIEPWTIEQHVGEAVFIPAGCPFQVRNLQSTVQLGLEFLSPESLRESTRMAQEIQTSTR